MRDRRAESSKKYHIRVKYRKLFHKNNKHIALLAETTAHTHSKPCRLGSSAKKHDG